MVSSVMTSFVTRKQKQKLLLRWEDLLYLDMLLLLPSKLKVVVALQALDINSDGFISKTELVSAGVRSGRRLSKVEVDAAFKEYDKNKVRSQRVSP